MRALGIAAAIFAVVSRGGAADRAPAGAAPSTVEHAPGRVAPPTTIQPEGPDPGEDDGETGTPELRDDDDGLDDGRDVPSAPALRPRRLPGAPDEEEEEPPPPPESEPSRSGPAEPASAMQPASPH